MKTTHCMAVLTAATVLGSGCGKDVTRPPAPGPSPGIVLDTDVGPVDVLSFRDDADGFRRIRVHTVRPDGVHAVRTLAVRETEDAGMLEFVATVADEDVRTFRMVRRIRSDDPHLMVVRLEGGGESLELRTEPAGGRIRTAVLHRSGDGSVRQVVRYIDAARTGDPVYAAAVRKELTGFYPSGVLVDHPDRRLLEAVLASADWDRYLEGASGGTDPKVEKRIQKVCGAASATAVVSCTASIWIPAAWLLCVPATGINIACTVYQIRQAFVNDFDAPCVCPCVCPENPPTPPPPDPNPNP